MTNAKHNSAIDLLTEAGIRPSAQRVAIMQYLMDNLTHPTVDEIFRALHPAWPTMSRTTVYNTLRLLTANGTVDSIDIDSGNAHYDYAPTGSHAHFMCKNCSRIFDLTEPAIPPPMMEGFEVTSASLCYKGFCPECSENRRHLINQIR